MKTLKILATALVISLTMCINSNAQEKRFESNMEGTSLIGFDVDCGFKGLFLPSIHYIGGLRLNSSNYIGLGIGIQTEWRLGTFAPIYINYKHLFNSTKQVSPMISLSAGTDINLTYSEVNPYFEFGYGYSYSLTPDNKIYSLIGIEFMMDFGCPIIGPSFRVGFAF